MGKVFVTFLASALIAGGAVFMIGQQQKNAALSEQKSDLELAFESERSKLEQQLKIARKRQSLSDEITTVADPVVASSEDLTPTEILDTLLQLKPGSGPAGNRTVRKIVYHLECLVQEGPEAVPTIAAFLARNEDIEYWQPRNQEGNDTTAQAGASQENAEEAAEREARRARMAAFSAFRSLNPNRRPSQLEFTYPPSLRVGLIDVLHQIGTPEAEQVLVTTLQSTGRALEVAYLDKILGELAPGQYRPLALQSAHELLASMPQADGSSRLDENAKNYLYDLLIAANDISFVGTAQALLVTPQGKLDPDALAYLNLVLKEQAVTAIYQAYRNPLLTNQFEKAALMGLGINYAGRNPQANQMFQDVMRDESMPAQMRAFAVMSMGGNFGRGRSDTPTDVNVLKARLQLLESVKPTVSEEFLVASIERTARTLQDQIEGRPADQRRGRGFGGFGGFGGGGFGF